MADERFQGWTNVETFIVFTHLTTEDDLWEKVSRLAEDAGSVCEMSDMVSDLITYHGDYEEGSMVAELMECALCRVNCDEIACEVFNRLGMEYYKHTDCAV